MKVFYPILINNKNVRNVGLIIVNSNNEILSSILSPLIVAIIGGLVIFWCEKIYVKYKELKDLKIKLRKQYSIALYNVYITNQIVKLSNQVLEKKIVSEFYFADYESLDIEMIIYVDDIIVGIRENKSEDEEMTLQIYLKFKDNLQKLLVYKRLLDDHLYEWKRSSDLNLESDMTEYYRKIRNHSSRMCVNTIQILDHFTIVLNKKFGLSLEPYKKLYCAEVYSEYKKLTKDKN